MTSIFERHTELYQDMRRQRDEAEAEIKEYVANRSYLRGLLRHRENERDEARAERDDLAAALRTIKDWSDAYPLTVFPEPNFGAAAEALKDAGLSLDTITASNMRHAIEGAGRIASEALATLNAKGRNRPPFDGEGGMAIDKGVGGEDDQ